MEQICCVILAAGMGKRMGGDLPKAIVKTREQALIDHVLDGLTPLHPVKTIVVTGHKKELIEQYLATSNSAQPHNLEFVFQEEQLGTGHAVKCAIPALEGFSGTVVLTYADHPLFRPSTIKLFLDFHQVKKATLSMVSFAAPVPNNYGRIIRSSTERTVSRITEAKDCSVEESLISEVNSGVYAVDSAFLKPALEALTNNNAQKEYYLTDIVEKASKEGQRVEAFLLPDAEEAGGVNNLTDLAQVNRVLSRRHIQKLVTSGVTVDDESSLFLDAAVSVEPGAKIGPNVQLRGATTIAKGVVLEGTNLIIDSTIGEGATIKLGSRLEGSIVGAESSVGPFANLRPGTNLGSHCRIGNFVETKNATLHDGAKASHLTYLGDCTVGKESNIGAGTITCNYDGYKKSQTVIGAGVFVGSNSSLVAPIKIGDGALVAAGSTITRDVPADSLGLARAKQEIKEGWAEKRRKVIKERR
jgi:bifunctional UDP-N-acetylglucosamine pyrophosphorylase/glucosamine-1-phosphate N-acetyltransferase